MKALREISNGGVTSSNSVNIKKHQTDASLDRLLLLHSDLSSLLRQTDELVVQALKIDLTRKGLDEIESFTQLLSSIQTSLKPWVPRMQKALSDNCSNHSDTEEAKMESMISSSPLVSWRPDFANEGGTQLFLLTPLPKPKSIASKLHLSRRKPPSSLVAISTNTKDDPLQSEGGGIMATPNKASLVVMRTPCLKMSPPKSCVVLEPISEVAPPKNRKSTPFPVGHNRRFSDSSESSSGDENDAFKDMVLKYSELMVQPENLGYGRKNIDSSPYWFLSPPKTCVVMEPQDDDEDSSKASLDLAAAKSINPRTEMETKHPGENTLKKELWSKFEAASDHSIRYLPPSTTQKRFLDRLDEASSCDG